MATHETEQHGGEGGDEAEGLIAAAVVLELGLAGEEVEEPLVEVVRGVGVLVPVGGKVFHAVLLRPLRADAVGDKIVGLRRERVEGEQAPVADEDRGQRGELDEEGAVPEQEEEEVAQTDLGDNVFEGPVGLWAARWSGGRRRGG